MSRRAVLAGLLLALPLCADATPPADPGAAAVRETVRSYAHYDGQPVVASQWTGDPWKPVLRDKPLEEGGREIPREFARAPINPEWRIYARSAVRPLTAAERRAIAQAPDADAALRRELGLGRVEGTGETLLETLMRPALNLRGVSGGDVGARATNSIPTEAAASIDFRLVPDQTPARVRTRLEDHLRKQGYTIVGETPDLETQLKTPRLVRLLWGSGYPAARTAMDLPVSRAVARVIEDAAGSPIVQLPTLGGSIPMYLFVDNLKTPAVGIPIVNHDNNQHAANENLRLKNLWDGIETCAALLTRLGHLWR